MDLLLTGAGCIVTGGTRGIGRATAELLLREGAAVSVIGRTAASVTAALEELSRWVGCTVLPAMLATKRTFAAPLRTRGDP